MKKYLIIILCLFVVSVNAQDSTKVEVVNDYKFTGKGGITYEMGTKQSEDPKFVDTIKVKSKIDYSVLATKKVESEYKIQPIKAPSVKLVQPLKKLYKGYAALGFNDFKTPPYFDFNYGLTRNKEFNAGIIANSFSSEMKMDNKDDARFTESHLELYGKKFLDKHTLYSSVSYDANTFRYYGYDDAAANNVPVGLDNRQHYFILNSNFGAKSHWKDKEALNHNIELNYDHIFDRFGVQEHLATLNANANRWYKYGVIDVDFEVSFLNATNLLVANQNSVLTKLAPRYNVKYENIDATAGFTTFYQAVSNPGLHFYPFLEANFTFVKDVMIVYGKWSGNYERNHYLTLVQSNPFISSGIPVMNTNTKSELTGGVKGAFNSKSSFNAGFLYKKMDGMVLFINDSSFFGNRKFMAIRDDVVMRRVFFEALYEGKKLLVGGEFHYSMYEAFENDPYHLPALYGKLNLSYNIQNKIRAGVDLFYYGEQKALVQYDAIGNPESKTLAPIFDFNLDVKYNYSDRLGAFARVNNILSTNHQRWNQYPNYGINFLVGVGYSF